MLSATVLGLSLVLSGTLVQAVAFADSKGAGRPGVQDVGDPVEGAIGKAEPRPSDPARKAAVTRLDKAVWPGQGSAEVPVGSAGTKSPAEVQAGGLTVSVTAPTGSAKRAQALPKGAPEGTALPGKVRVEVLDPERAALLGAGALLRVQRADDSDRPAKVRLNVDYSSFAEGYGGGYGARLRLVQLPACAAVAKPGSKACPALPRPLPTMNNGETHTVSADVAASPAPAGVSTMAVESGSMVALSAGDSSSQGSYAATPLAPSAKWTVSNSSGGFSWNYPLRVPPAPGGLVPSIGLGYSSQAADGRTSDTNNQGSWIGEGFSYEPGYVERRYKACADDGHKESAEQCWAFDNATILLNGMSTEIIKDDTTGKWRLANDDGTKVEKVTSPGNGDNDNEYWKITTTDGTEYHFGRNRLPGWASGNEETKSVWTMPVFGDDSGEPCYNATFTSAHCNQAWRWSLDYVKDTHGNVVSYFYEPETNHYALNGKTDVNGTAYHRGGYLKRADYGQRDGLVYTGKAPARVVFDTAERCLPTTTFACGGTDFKKENAAHWPDVPMDQYCAVNTKCTASQVAASFWTRMRLTGVTTQIRKDATTYRDVDAWRFTHLFTDNGDDSKTLWLSKIDHEGRVETTAKLPTLELHGIQLANRVDAIGDNIAPFHRFRLAAVLSETGAQLDINYAPTECTKDALPAPGASAKRCYPVKWSPPGYIDPITDWFHKYVVAEVVETDRTGGGEKLATRYDYQGPAAWRKAEPDGITEDKYLTWGSWQGYGKVKVTSGSPENQTTRIDYTYLQGMDGDKLPDGTSRSSAVTDSEGGSYTDHKEFTGHELESATYDGTKLVSKVINTPSRWFTATDTNTWGTTKASITKTTKVRGYTVTEGGDGRRETESNTKYDTVNGTGRVLEAEDLGDLSTTADDQCTRTSYADNTAANIFDLTSRTETVAVRCSTAPDRKTQVISDERISYDGLAFGATPTKGDVTRTERLKSHDGTTATYQTTATTTYDVFGRPLTQTDAVGAETKLSYTDVNGLIAQNKATNALGHVTTTDYNPAWGVSTGQTDANGKRTDLAYDGLGRLVSVWLKDRLKTQTPSIKYEYLVRRDAVVAIKTQKIENDGTYGTEYMLYDSLLRPRQKQTEGPGGTRMVADSFYGGTSKVRSVNLTYNAAGAPSDQLLVVHNGEVGAQTRYEYDGLGRTTAEVFGVSGVEQWRTKYVHGGDRTHIDPPVGGTPTTTLTDARGRTTEMWHYKSPDFAFVGPIAEHDVTKYAYTPAGQLKQLTDADGNVWTYAYDQRGRKTESDDPDSGKLTVAYDDADRPVSSTDARGRTVSTVYDKLGRITTTWEGAPTTGTKLTEQRYDKAGWLGEQYVSLRYINATEYFGTAVQSMDDFYRPLKTAYAVPASQGAIAGTYVYTSAYNRDGTLQTTGVPAAGGLAGEAFEYSYDELQRVKTMRSALSSYVTDTVYSSTSQLLQLELTDGGRKNWQTFAYEKGTDRLTRSLLDIQGSTSGPAKESNYSYDQVGHVLSIADTAGTGTPDTQCFRYDYQARMTEAWTPSTPKDAATASGTIGSQAPVGGSGPTACGTSPGSSPLGGPAPYWSSYTFDAVGNRLSETAHHTGLDTTKDVKRTFSYNAGTHQVSKVVESTPIGDRQYSYGYDAAGNTTARTIGGDTQTLTYDALGKVTKNSRADDVTTPDKNEASETTFLYGPDGQRIMRKDPTGTTVYLPGTELRLDAGTTTAKATRYYSYGDRSIAVRTNDNKLSFVASDHHGTGELSVDATTGAIAQRRFDPYGSPRGSQPESGSWPGEKGFVGGTMDASTGLTTVGAREYDSFLGKFISPDPVVDHADPQQLNAYAYAHNRPVSASDPTGLYDPDAMAWCQQNPGQCTGGKPTTSKPGKPKPTAPSKASADVSRATENLGKAEQQLSGAKQQVSGAVDKLIKIAKDQLGVDAALDCFSSGDLGSCGETALNVVSSFAGGLLGKVVAKYGLRVDKAASLLKRIAGLAADLVSGLKKWWDSSKAVDKAKGALTAAKERLKKSSCPVPHSFLPGTKVLLADGTTKKIENVKLGDKITTTDPTTGKKIARPVVGTIVTKDDKHFVDLTLVTAKGPVSLVSTTTHPFWVENKGAFIEAGDLKPGMLLRTPDGALVPVQGMRLFEERQRTHDLTVGDVHTYYVLAGATPVLVHNSNECGVARNEKGQFTSGENADAARGRQTHLNYRNALGDGYDFEVRLPSGLRPDAVDWKNRVVRELKSDAKSSMATGRRQLDKYVAELEETTGQSWTGRLDVYKRF